MKKETNRNVCSTKKCQRGQPDLLNRVHQMPLQTHLYHVSIFSLHLQGCPRLHLLYEQLLQGACGMWST